MWLSCATARKWLWKKQPTVWVLKHVEDTSISGDQAGSRSVPGAYLKTSVNFAVGHEVTEVVRDFQNVPTLKGRRCWLEWKMPHPCCWQHGWFSLSPHDGVWAAGLAWPRGLCWGAQGSCWGTLTCNSVGWNTAAMGASCTVLQLNRLCATLATLEKLFLFPSLVFCLQHPSPFQCWSCVIKRDLFLGSGCCSDRGRLSEALRREFSFLVMRESPLYGGNVCALEEAGLALGPVQSCSDFSQNLCSALALPEGSSCAKLDSLSFHELSCSVPKNRI